MITLGTGVGGGIIVDGKIIDGSRGYGGEIGHMTVDPLMIVYVIVERQAACSFMHLQRELYMRQRKH